MSSQTFLRHCLKQMTSTALMIVSLLVLTTGMLTDGVAHAQSDQSAADISGRWHGTLVAGQFDPLEVFFQIEGQPGAWRATLDIPAHSRLGLQADSISVRNGNIMIRINSLQAEYYGALLLEQGKVISMDGDWSQSGEHIPLKLIPVAP